jgi:NarL family two-component system response regulator YdfI
VLVCADEADELAELETTVRESASLRLVGSSLGRTRLSKLIARIRPDVLVEHGEVDDAGDELADALLARILLVGERQVASALDAMRSSDTSIRAVLPAWSSDWELRAAIAAAAEGLLVLHPDFASRALAAPSQVAHDSGPAAQALSPRESEILNLLAAGLGNKQIASQLNISEHTVKFHVASIFNKLNASSRAEAVAIGARRGLILL